MINSNIEIEHLVYIKAISKDFRLLPTGRPCSQMTLLRTHWSSLLGAILPAMAEPLPS